ncbi:hypothetical protein BDQ94DRAFT_147879 [Aspergillus welwitschiae]|uniref:Uncharacterized protein n=1 Tax=Aspergillus welwitschiae TaxID=1341132 RepID=A0A3F3PVP1_9EURO|nr:hypothetical protein BDQ94DRAFT_147879 [Aspergillus welwitschiae]RDH31000.1 hypothetical protein BDQ94DRAFT_147879 [Aspergillus welwitschiae]
MRRMNGYCEQVFSAVGWKPKLGLCVTLLTYTVAHLFRREKTKFTKLVEKVEIDTSVVCSFEEAAWIRKGVINTERERANTSNFRGSYSGYALSRFCTSSALWPQNKLEPESRHYFCSIELTRSITTRILVEREQALS